MEKKLCFIVSLLLLGLTALAVAEKFEKVKGTSGEFSDIVIDSKGRWYVVKNKQLLSCILSLDKDITCERIKIPSNENVHKGLGIDQFDNIYIQDYTLNIFIVTPSLNGGFVFDNVTNYDDKKLVNRPFALSDNVVHFATNKRLMYLENSEEYPSTIDFPLRSEKNITHWVNSNNTRFGSEYQYTFFSIGGPRYWVYVKHGHIIKPVAQILSFMKNMQAVGDHIYCIVNGEKQVKLIHFRDTMFVSTAMNKESSYTTTIEGIDLSNMDIEDDFIIYSPEHDYKTYLYGNIDNKGVIYELGDNKVNGKFKTKVTAEHRLDNVRILCGAIGKTQLYFGTTDGVYEMTDMN